MFPSDCPRGRQREMGGRGRSAVGGVVGGRKGKEGKRRGGKVESERRGGGYVLRSTSSSRSGLCERFFLRLSLVRCRERSCAVDCNALQLPPTIISFAPLAFLSFGQEASVRVEEEEEEAEGIDDIRSSLGISQDPSFL